MNRNSYPLARFCLWCEIRFIFWHQVDWHKLCFFNFFYSWYPEDGYGFWLTFPPVTLWGVMWFRVNYYHINRMHCSEMFYTEYIVIDVCPLILAFRAECTTASQSYCCDFSDSKAELLCSGLPAVIECYLLYLQFCIIFQTAFKFQLH